MKTLLPLFLIVIAVGLFLVYTNPTYLAIKVSQVEATQYDQALTQSSQLRSARDQLLSRRNTFSSDDVRKLERILPDNVDNIRLIIDIDNIAARYGLQVKDVALGQTSATPGSQTASVGQGSQVVGTVDLGFAVSATYDNFMAFLQDLQRSVRIVDIESITFSAGTGDLNTYGLQIKTYWLR